MFDLELLKTFVEHYSDTFIEKIAETSGESTAKRFLQVLKYLRIVPPNSDQRQIENKNKEENDSPENEKSTINATAENVAETPDIEQEYANRIISQGLGWTFKEVENVNIIVGDTGTNLMNNPPPDGDKTDQPTGNISEDWLNEFRSVACKKNTEEARDLFSKLLEREIRNPGSSSFLTVTTLANMNHEVVQLFKAFCSLCLVSLDNPAAYYRTQSKSFFKIKDARIPIIKDSFYDGAAIGSLTDMSQAIESSKRIYQMYGFRFENFKLLMEYNLIVDHTNIDYYTIWYNNELWGLKPSDAYSSDSVEEHKSVKLTGYALTSVGIELYNIVEFNTRPDYWDRISNFIQKYYAVKLEKYPNKVSSPQNRPSSEKSAVSGAVDPFNEPDK